MTQEAWADYYENWSPHDDCTVAEVAVAIHDARSRWHRFWQMLPVCCCKSCNRLAAAVREVQP